MFWSWLLQPVTRNAADNMVRSAVKARERVITLFPAAKRLNLIWWQL